MIRLADQLSDHLQEGTVPSRQLRSRYAEQVRQYLVQVWNDQDITEASLGIVGSFARAEGGPRSDLDVVILLGTNAKTAQVGSLVRTLWDSGLHVDYCARTIKETTAMARQDMAVLTGLIDLSHVAGDPALTKDAVGQVLADFRQAARRRVSDLLDEAQLRWQQFDRIDRLNEPDLKSCLGGIRDVSLLRALSASWLADFPHREVAAASDTVLGIRDALHQVSGRHVSALSRGWQPDVTRIAGYQCETQMMRSLQEAGAVLAEAALGAAETARQTQNAWGSGALARRVRLPQPPKRRRKNLSEAEEVGALLITHRQIDFLDPTSATSPDLALELAQYGAKQKISIGAATLSDLESQPKMDWTRHRLDEFVGLLNSGEGLRKTWTELDSAGVIVAWLPQWAALRGRPQSAAFHRWTVDRHLIEVVIHASAILSGTEPKLTLNLPIAGVPVRPVLLAALLHDLGKQLPEAGADHPSLGRDLAVPLLNGLPLPHGERQLVSALIEHHLLLARLAIDEDPLDPRTITYLWQALGNNKTYLDSLAVLTCADSLGAGPKAWTPWREQLIGRLLEGAEAHRPT